MIVKLCFLSCFNGCHNPGELFSVLVFHHSSVNYLDSDILGNPGVIHSFTRNSFTLHLKGTVIGHTFVTGMSNGIGHTWVTEDAILTVFQIIGILCQVWCLIVSISDLCPLSYIVILKKMFCEF